MSLLSSDTVDEFRKNYDKYFEKIVEKIKNLEDACKTIETDLKNTIEEGVFSPVELKNRKNKKVKALRGLKEEQKAAKGIRLRLSMQPSKEDTDEKFTKEIRSLEFYNAGEWKD